MALDYPSIDISNRTNEENMQSTKSYLIGLADTYNYQINELLDRISILESTINNLKGGE